MGIPSKLVEKIKDRFYSFHCEACGKKCNNKEQPKFCIYLEKWYEQEARSGTEVKLCPECAKPVIDVIKKAKVFASLKKKEVDVDVTKSDKPYHFGN
jgi:NAD-dependent SIR2 family protein deacetylase